MIELASDVDRNQVVIKILYTVKNAASVFSADIALQRTR
jgi:hypothetical protein